MSELKRMSMDDYNQIRCNEETVPSVKPEVNFKYSEIIFRDVYCEHTEQQAWDEYRKNWFTIPQRWIVTEFPMHLDLEVTNVCNLLCPMCPRTQLIERGLSYKPRYMSFETFRKVIDQAKGKNLYAINLNASGEPLFNWDLVRMIEYAKQRDILDVMFHTNATLLDKKISEDLIDSGLNKLIVSFDSPDVGRYEKIRKGASFNQVVDNVRHFAILRKQKGKLTPHLRINMVVMKENYHEQQMMIDFWQDYADSIGFLQYINFFHMDKDDRAIEIERGLYDKHFICEKLWQRLAISEEGRIKFCHMDDEGRVFIGNINKDDVGAIWKGKQMEYYRQLHIKGAIMEIPLCRECGVPIR